jgi:tetratricopeptide (TPR) repeat protein
VYADGETAVVPPPDACVEFTKSEYRSTLICCHDRPLQRMRLQANRFRDTICGAYRRSLMSRACALIFVVLVAGNVAFGQVQTLTIPAGSPEDKDLTAITAEQDNQKRIPMYQEYIQKYSGNSTAVAYANWQLAQSYQAAGDLQKALEAGDKANAAAPNSLDILVSQVTIAQQLKNNAAAFKYAIAGGVVYNSIDKEPKPADITAEQFASDQETEKANNKSSHDFFQNSAFSAISVETDPKTRMDEIETFSATFPKSGMDEQLASYAMLSLSQLKDNKRLVAYAEKALESNPDNLAALVMLANSYADANEPAKAVSYAQKAVIAAKADAPDADRSRKIAAGSAHSILGRVYANQGKTLPSITELKSATALLKGQDEQQYAIAGYYLGWDYAKLSKLTEARAVLTEVAALPGPVQTAAKELLTKVNTARAAGK